MFKFFSDASHGAIRSSLMTFSVIAIFLGINNDLYVPVGFLWDPAGDPYQIENKPIRYVLVAMIGYLLFLFWLRQSEGEVKKLKVLETEAAKKLEEKRQVSAGLEELMGALRSNQAVFAAHLRVVKETHPVLSESPCFEKSVVDAQIDRLEQLRADFDTLDQSELSLKEYTAQAHGDLHRIRDRIREEIGLYANAQELWGDTVLSTGEIIEAVKRSLSLLENKATMIEDASRRALGISEAFCKKSSGVRRREQVDRVLVQTALPVGMGVVALFCCVWPQTAQQLWQYLSKIVPF